MRWLSAALTLVLSLLPPALAAGDAPGPSFRGVGDAPGGDFLSRAYGVSPNGRFVVGVTEAQSRAVAFRWEDGTLETLGWLTWLTTTNGQVSTSASSARAVSSDGSVVGIVCTPTLPIYYCAAARFAGSSPVPIQPEVDLVGEDIDWWDGAATDITADGSAIYGEYALLYLWGLDEYGGVFRWQNSVTTVLTSNMWFTARYWGTRVSPEGDAYAYTAATLENFDGEVVLHRLGEDTSLGPGTVGDVSKLGLVVVGRSSSQAARWQGGSVTLLGDLPGGAEESEALAVSDSGHVIAGWGTTAAGTEAFLWTLEGGMQRLADVLTGHGLDLGGWTLRRATGLSASGRTVVGWGTNPSGDTEGFVATLPAREIPAPALGPLGLGLLVATLAAAASAAVRRGQRSSAAPATR